MRILPLLFLLGLTASVLHAQIEHPSKARAPRGAEPETPIKIITLQHASGEESGLEEFLQRVEKRRPGSRHKRNAADQITQLNLKYVKNLQPGDFPLIGALTQLRSLNLHGANVTDAHVKHLAGLAQLRELSLSSTKVGDAGLAELQNLKRLESLELRLTKITDKGIEVLGGLRQVRHLDISDTAITDAALEKLLGAIAIEALHLGDTKITDDGLRWLKRLPNLKSVTLNETGVTQAGLDSLATVPALHWINEPDAVVEELIRRVEASDFEGVDRMCYAGVNLPARGVFRRLKLEKQPPSDRDNKRGWQRYHLVFYWLVPAEMQEETLYFKVAIDRGAILGLEVGIRE